MHRGWGPDGTDVSRAGRPGLLSASPGLETQAPELLCAAQWLTRQVCLLICLEAEDRPGSAVHKESILVTRVILPNTDYFSELFLSQVKFRTEETLKCPQNPM